MSTASQISYPLFNGVYPSFADVICIIQPQITLDVSIQALFSGAASANFPAIALGFSAINFEDGMDDKKVYGSSVLPLGRTRGQYSASGDMEWKLPQFNSFMDQISVVGPGYMEIPFAIQIQYTTFQAPNVLISRQLLGVKLSKVSDPYSGDGELMVKCNLSVMQILRNGNNGTFGLPSIVQGFPKVF